MMADWFDYGEVQGPDREYQFPELGDREGYFWPLLQDLIRK